MNRSVQKISPSRPNSFDQQLWPVLVAITVLTGIAFGAVLTVLNGPWMWGSLFGLPVLSLVAIVLLFHLDDRRLRRSFQFAIILSMAVHLLILIVASVTVVFENPFTIPERPVAQRKSVRTIEISDQRASFVWEQTNARETPEPEVEPTRQQPPTTEFKPQPIPVEETQPQVNPQLTRKPTPQSSVPRQDQSLSRLRRQRTTLQPRSSEPLESPTERVAEATPSSAESSPAQAAPRADQVARQTPAASPAAEAALKSVEAAAAPAPSAESNPSPSAARRARAAEAIARSAPDPSPSSARIRRPTTRLPVAGQSAPSRTPTVTRASTNQPTADEPSQMAGELTRRPTRSPTTRPERVTPTPPSLSPSTQVAQAAQRRANVTVPPSISNPVSPTTQPRRATAEAPVASSPVSIEKPARAPQSNTASRELSPRTLSVTRQVEGAAGMGRARNLDRFAGGQPTPATQASDSARRERTTSQPNQMQLLTSSQKSDLRRSRGQAALPTSAFQADTDAAAKLAGVAQPSETTAESSAARITAAATDHRDERSAERGDASVDLGPTKIVNDQRRSERRSGGGQPEVAQLSPDLTRPSRDQSDQPPSLVADTGAEVAAPRNLSSAPASVTEIAASSAAAVSTRRGGVAAITAPRATAAVQGSAQDQGDVDLDQYVADSRTADRADRDPSGATADDDPPEDELDQRGRSRSPVALAPVIELDPGLGLARNAGDAEDEAARIGEEMTASDVARLARRSTSLQRRTGVGRAETDVLSPGSSASEVASESAATRRRSERKSDVGGGNSASSPTELAESDRPRPTSATGLATDATAEVDPAALASSADGQGADSKAADTELEARPVDVARNRSQPGSSPPGFELDVLAEEGPAGLGQQPDESIGMLARPASRDSEQLLPDMNQRFRNRDFGGAPAVNPDAVLARQAFRSRSPAAVSQVADPSTEASIQLGLEFLARYQSPDGSWSLTGFDLEAPQQMTQLDSDTAATGLAVLAFQGAGYNHREYKYAAQLDRAINWLIDHQDESGGLYVSTDQKSNSACRLYSHGIAALALTEAYGMTQDPKLKGPAQAALDYIRDSQDPRKGGWRYFVQPGKRSADTSVSGWMMMAMQSGRLAGLDVPEQSFHGVEDWLDQAADPENPSLFRYNPYAVDSKGISRIQGKRPSPSMTSVGLLMRIYSGWEKDDPRLLAGAEYLLQSQLPSDATPVLRDTYYWYYATQVLKHVGGEPWQKWNDRLRPLLTGSQQKTGDLAGSWHPYRPVPDRWGAFGGRLYVTTMNLLSLEVRHRLLPLYQQDQPPLRITGIIESGRLLTEAELASTTLPPAYLDSATADASEASSVASVQGSLTLPVATPPQKPKVDLATQPLDAAAGDLARLRPRSSPLPARSPLAGAVPWPRPTGAAAHTTKPIPKRLPSTDMTGFDDGTVAAARVGPLPANRRSEIRLVNGEETDSIALPWAVGEPSPREQVASAQTELPAAKQPPISFGNSVELSADAVRIKTRLRPRGPADEGIPTVAWTSRIVARVPEMGRPRPDIDAPESLGIAGLEERYSSVGRNAAPIDLTIEGDRPSIGMVWLAGGPATVSRVQLPPVAQSIRLSVSTLKPPLPPSSEPVSQDAGLADRTTPEPRLFQSDSSQVLPVSPGSSSVITPPIRAVNGWNAAASSPPPALWRRLLPAEGRRIDQLADEFRNGLVDRPMRPVAKLAVAPVAVLKKIRTAMAAAKPAGYGEVFGTVKLDGEALEGARVQFVPLAPAAGEAPVNPGMAALTNRLGQYSITPQNAPNGKGILSGEYRVVVTTTSVSEDVNVIDKLEVVPAKYNEQSELKVRIQPDKRTSANWKLESVVR